MKQLFPHKVRVFGVDLPINYIKQPLLDGVEVDGLFQDSEIIIKACLSPKSMQEVLLHEVAHAIDEVMQIKLSEKQITQLARGLLGVLCDSPEFKKFLLEVGA
jgi:hypothetical protein